MADKKTISLFGSKKPVQSNIPPPDDGKTLRMMKVIEERLSNLDKKTELIENNILSINKRQNVEIKTINSKLLEVEKDISLIKRRIIEIASDLKNFARVEEVEALRKYLDLWEPLNFMTRNEAENIIQELFEKKFGSSIMELRSRKV